MILSKRAALNGVQLDELFPEIVIRSVDPGVPHETVSAVNIATENSRNKSFFIVEIN